MIYKKWNYRNYQPLSLIYYPRSPITDSCNFITVIINYHRQLIARERSSDHRFGWTPRGRTAARSATTMFQSLCAKPRTYKQLAGKAGDKNETKDFREPKIRCRTGGRKKRKSDEHGAGITDRSEKVVPSPGTPVWICMCAPEIRQ